MKGVANKVYRKEKKEKEEIAKEVQYPVKRV